MATVTQELLRELVALVRGECPSLLNEDSGGDVRLSMAIDDALASPPAKDIWRCFHCGEVFTTWGSAQDHFGVRDGVVPGCLIDQVAVEEGGKPERGRGLLMALRTAEAAYERLQAQQLEEDTTLHRELARVRSEMDAAVRRAEEAGYARGLAAALASPPAEDENALRAAWEAGFRLCRRYGDNHHHWDGEQRERRWRQYLAQVAQAPPASDPPGLVANWRPIETAPKRTDVLAGWADRPHWLPQVLQQDDAGMWFNGEESDYRPPTHWMPLPASPQAETMPTIQVGDVDADDMQCCDACGASRSCECGQLPASPQAKED